MDILSWVFYPVNFWYLKISGANSDITWVFQHWRYLNFNIPWLFQHWQYSNCLVTWNFPKHNFFPRAGTRPVVARRQNSACSSLVAKKLCQGLSDLSGILLDQKYKQKLGSVVLWLSRWGVVNFFSGNILNTLTEVVFHQMSSSVIVFHLSKAITCQRLFSFKGRLPSKLVFRQRSSSVKGPLPSKALFRQRLSSVKGRHPSKDI